MNDHEDPPGWRLVLQGAELERYGRTEEAEQAYREAAELGELNGLYNSGVMAERRGGTAEARDFYVRAHIAGHPEAANNLGVLLYNAGDPDALAWFRVAESMGHSQAAGNAKVLEASRSWATRTLLKRPAVLYLNSQIAYERFALTGNDAALVQAVNLKREAVRRARPSHPMLLEMLADLRDILRYRYELRGDTADLAEAVDVAAEALKALKPRHPERLTAVQVLIALLNAQFLLSSDPGPLLTAVGVGMTVQKQRRGTKQARAALESSLCAALAVLHRDADAEVDLNKAIEFGRSAVRRLPGNPTPLNNLGLALSLRGKQRGSLDDLNEAVEMFRDAVEAASNASDQKQIRSSSAGLMAALHARAELVGRAADEHEARRLAVQIRLAAQSEPAYLPEPLITAAFTADDLSSVEATRLALHALPPGHANRPPLLAHLASILHNAGEREEAIAMAREAAVLAMSPKTRMEVNHILGSLLLRVDADHADKPNAVTEAVTAFEASADALEESDTAYARVMTGLAEALLDRHARDAGVADHEKALAALRAAAGAKGSSAQERLLASRRWAGEAWHAGDAADALTASRVAVSLFSEFGWVGLDRVDQEQGLSAGAAMPRDAAALAIIAGDPRLAVELLEEGRSVLWRSTLHLREDLAALAAQKPALAAELERIRATLNHDATLSPESRLRLANRWTETLAKVRKLNDFTSFLCPPSFDALALAAEHGPVVIVNISTIRCDALLLLPGGRVEVLELPRVNVPEMDKISNTYREHLAAAQQPDSTSKEKERARRTVHDTLEWLWERIAKPVLDRLALPCESANPPRLWWCPTASLAGLPLHAAGRYPRTDADPEPSVGVPFAVVSSYTSTLSSLIDARRRPAAADPRLVAIGLADTGRGHRPLPGVATELRMLEQTLDPGRLTILADDAATVAAVREQLPDHAWAHFACHGSLDMVSPSTSGLALHDGDMNVLDFADLPLQTADLTFLSACHTALGGGLLLDEAIHTAAALRVAGFRHVIATQWSVEDMAALYLSAAFYRHLGVSGPLDSSEAALALHRAVAELRDANPTDPALWVPFVHDGP